MLALKKPGTGIPPSKIEAVLGRRTRKTLGRDDQILEGDLE
jgi:sialic acid synthase SpsE